MDLFPRCSRCVKKSATVNCESCQTKRCYECDIQAHQPEELKIHQRRVVSFQEMINKSRRGEMSASRTQGSYAQSPSRDYGFYTSRQKDTRIMETFDRMRIQEENQDKLVQSLQNQIQNLKQEQE